MKRSILPRLRCPSCGTSHPFQVEVLAEEGDEVGAGKLRCSACPSIFPIVDSIPRFVSDETYAKSFGSQWNRFRRTQLDSNSGTRISRDRFSKQTEWDTVSLQGACVLDAGCGAGRFSEGWGAEVVAVDYSVAVDACREDLRGHSRLHVFQADICAMPFVPGYFDYVYSFGVLQHTPDVAKTVLSLARQLKPGGYLCIDVYMKQWKNLFASK